MPGWHEATLEAQQAGQLRMVGILQEQHPDRARLFMQWQEMDWPLMVDALDVLGVEVVPITLLVDEAGVVRQVGARPADLADFLARPPAEAEPVDTGPPEMWTRTDERVPRREALRRRAEVVDDAATWRTYGRHLVHWNGPGSHDAAVDAFLRAVRHAPEDGRARFELGVALLRRYDSPGRRDGDFRGAVAAWTRAMELQPSQYIWQRRVQQYGPREQKPYPFYDWIEEARQAIRARGETPVELVTEPTGAEIASAGE